MRPSLLWAAIVAAMAGEAPPAPAFPSEGALAHWSFNENTGTAVADSTTFGNDAVANSSSVWAPAGKQGSGLSAAGAHHANIGTVENILGVPEDEYAFACWVYLDGVNTTTVRLMNLGFLSSSDPGTNIGLTFTLGTNGLYVRLVQGDAAAGWNGLNRGLWQTTLVPQAGWNLFIVNRHAAGAEAYLYNAGGTSTDSVVASLAPLNGWAYGVTKSSLIGADTNTTANNNITATNAEAGAVIDEITMWGRTLTASDRAALWNNGSGVEYAPPTPWPIPTDSLYAELLMDDVVGSTITNTGTGPDGTLVGSAVVESDPALMLSERPYVHFYNGGVGTETQTDHGIELVGSTAFDLNASHTISVWVRRPRDWVPGNNAYKSIVTKGGSYTANSMTIRVYEKNVGSDVRWEGSYGSALITTDKAALTDEWVHVLCINDVENGRRRYFLNGRLVESYTAGNWSAHGSYNLRIGFSYDNEWTWEGYATLPRVYSRALTFLEARALYHEGVPAQYEGAAILNPFHPDLLTYHKFDALSGYDSRERYAATLVGSFTAVEGHRDTAVKADNLNAYVSIPSLGSWFANRSAFTLSFWDVVPAASAATDFVFAVSNTTHADPYYRVCVVIDETEFGVRINGYQGANVVKYTWPSGAPTSRDHYAVRFSSGSVALFFNGAEVASGSGLGATIGGCKSDVLLGRIPAANSSSNAAAVNRDEMRIFKTALSDADILALASEVVVVTPNPWDIPADNLATHWTMGSISGTTLVDETGNHDGTINGTISYTPGYIGRALWFDGSTTWVDTGYTVPAISSVSFSCWFKAGGSATQVFFADSNAAGQNASARAVLGVWSTDKFYVNMGDGASSWYDNTTVDASPYLDLEWHHAVLVVSGTSQKLYVDGALIHTYTATVALGTAGAQTYKLGRNGGFDGSYTNGAFNRFRVYEGALTAQEVLALYAELPTLPTAGLTAQYLMTDSAVGSLVDSVGSHPGTMAGVELKAGRFGKSLDFNGTSNFVTMTAITSVAAVSFWVKSSQTGTLKYVFDNDTSGVRSVVATRNHAGDLGFFDNASWYSVKSGAAVNDGSWHHVVYTHDAGTTTWYVDGVQEFQQATNALGFGGMFKMGRHNTASENFFAGFVDHVRFYTQPLTHDEVLRLYQEAPLDRFIARWGMAGVATDYHGFYNMTLNNGAVQNSDHVAFDGVNDYGQTARLPLDGAFTVAVRFRLNTIDMTFGDWVINSRSSGAGVGYEWQLGLYPPNTGNVAKLRLAVNNTAGTAYVTDSTTTLVAGTWYVFVAQFDGTEVRLYNETDLEGATAFSGTKQVGSAHTRFASRGWDAVVADTCAHIDISRCEVFDHAVAPAHLHRIVDNLKNGYE